MLFSGLSIACETFSAYTDRICPKQPASDNLAQLAERGTVCPASFLSLRKIGLCNQWPAQLSRLAR